MNIKCEAFKKQNKFLEIAKRSKKKMLLEVNEHKK